MKLRVLNNNGEASMTRQDTIKALADVLGDYLPDSRADLLEVAEKLLNLYEAGKLPHLAK